MLTPHAGTSAPSVPHLSLDSHPIGLCPFPTLPGWLGPTAQTIAALDKNNANANKKPHQGDTKGKKGGDTKGKGKRHEYSNFF
ncbi:hypothetical protein B0H14DRAFT_3531912 [Mycena olivaceomarginata]|nr:hypothetical protein B0H14DRAFT_3531912 [Mycena olivaceomarginata]